MSETNTLQEKLIRIGKKHFRDEMLPMLQKRGTGSDGLVVAISGSVSYGYCDAFSDIDLTVYLRLESKEGDSIRTNTLMDFQAERIRVSYRFASYQEIERFLVDRDQIVWETVNPYTLFDLKHVIPVHDCDGILRRLQREYDFYPDDEFVQIVRGLWITINGSGLYQASQSLERQDHQTANIFFYRAVEALVRMIYILNHEYFPHTKWLFAGLSGLDNTFQWYNHAPEMSEEKSLDARIGAFLKVTENVKEQIHKDEILNAECIEKFGSNFKFPFRVFKIF